MTHPVLLRAIVVDADNKAIRIKEGASTVTVNLAEGTHYLRGDGTADDLCKVLKDALDAAGAANTYTVALALSADPAAVSAVVTITQSGGATFQLLWADAATTALSTWFGFADADTADSTAAKTSTLTPSALWVGDGPHVEHEPKDKAREFAKRVLSARVRRGKTGTTAKDRTLAVSWVCGPRTHSMHASGGDVARTFSAFLDEWREGSPAELHFVDPSAGFTLAALSSSTSKGKWHVGDENERFEPQRQSNAVQLYSWSLLLWEHVA